MKTLVCSPIGFAKTKRFTKFDTPSQPSYHIATDQNKFDHIELINESKYVNGLSDLKEFSHIWIIWWFHKNSSWKSKVLPPRGDATKRGVFATRSPHRPNPIGISCVELKKIYGNKIFIGNNDFINDTPILDIKPYLAPVDSIPKATLGWTSTLFSDQQNLQAYTIEIDLKAKKQIDFLRQNYNIDFFSKAKAILSNNPYPHKSRRIVKVKENTFKMGCGGWRIFFTITNNLVSIEKISCGYSQEYLNKVTYQNIPDKTAQIEFLHRWPD